MFDAKMSTNIQSVSENRRTPPVRGVPIKENHNFGKQIPYCIFYRYRVCKYGTKCNYIHKGKSETICKYFLREMCFFGSKCHYSHQKSKEQNCGSPFNNKKILHYKVNKLQKEVQQLKEVVKALTSKVNARLIQGSTLKLVDHKTEILDIPAENMMVKQMQTQKVQQQGMKPEQKQQQQEQQKQQQKKMQQIKQQQQNHIMMQKSRKIETRGKSHKENSLKKTEENGKIEEKKAVLRNSSQTIDSNEKTTSAKDINKKVDPQNKSQEDSSEEKKANLKETEEPTSAPVLKEETEKHLLFDKKEEFIEKRVNMLGSWTTVRFPVNSSQNCKLVDCNFENNLRNHFTKMH